MTVLNANGKNLTHNIVHPLERLNHRLHEKALGGIERKIVLGHFHQFCSKCHRNILRTQAGARGLYSPLCNSSKEPKSSSGKVHIPYLGSSSDKEIGNPIGGDCLFSLEFSLYQCIVAAGLRYVPHHERTIRAIRPCMFVCSAIKQIETNAFPFPG